MADRHPNEVLFGHRLKLVRTAVGLNMRQLHDKSGAGINTISRAERGLGISFGNAARIAEGLGFTLAGFLTVDICENCGNQARPGWACTTCEQGDPRV